MTEKIYLPHGFLIHEGKHLVYAEVGEYSEDEVLKSGYKLDLVRRWKYNPTGLIVYTREDIPACEIVNSNVRVQGIKRVWVKL